LARGASDPGGGGRGYFAACLRGIGRPDEDRHPLLLREPRRESDMVDVAVGKQQRSDMLGDRPIASSSRNRFFQWPRRPASMVA
jgi:hypothetical protein